MEIKMLILKNYAYNDFGNLIAMETSNSGSQLMETKFSLHAVNSKTDAIAQTSNSGQQSMGNEVPTAETIDYAYNSRSEVTATNSPNQNSVANFNLSGNSATLENSFNYATFLSPEIIENPFRFSSKYHDDELSLIYYNYRHYNPTTARWISRDPIEEQGGTNLYNFTANNPINYFDVLGLFFKDECVEGEKEFVNAYVVVNRGNSENSIDDVGQMKDIQENLEKIEHIFGIVRLAKGIAKYGLKETLSMMSKDKAKSKAFEKIGIYNLSSISTYGALFSAATKFGVKMAVKKYDWRGWSVIEYRECECKGFIFKNMKWSNKKSEKSYDSEFGNFYADKTEIDAYNRASKGLSTHKREVMNEK